MCDLFLSPEFKPLDKHRWLPQAFAPMFLDIHRPIIQRQEFGEDKDIDVLFTGTYLPQCTFRTEVLKAVDEKFKLHVCSVTQNEWNEQGLKDVNPPVPKIFYVKFQPYFWFDKVNKVLVSGGND